MTILDQDLVGRSFWLPADVEPENLENLLPAIRPANEDKPEFEYLYDRAPGKGGSRDLIFCAHCRRQNHYAGYVLRYVDGARVLIGNVCGGHHYGVWFHTKEREFQEQMSRANALSRVNRSSEAFFPAIAEVEAIVESNWFETAASPATDFQNRFRKMSDELLSASDGVLMSIGQSRNYDAENQRDEKIDREIRRRAQAAGMDQDDYARENHKAIASDPALKKPPIYMNVEREFGRLSGYRYLPNALKKPQAKAEALAAELREIGENIATLSTDGMATTDLLTELRSAGHTVKAIADHVATIADGAVFFSVTNLRTIAGWAAAKGTAEGSYKVESGRFVLELRDGHRFPFDPQFPDAPALANLNALRRALTD